MKITYLVNERQTDGSLALAEATSAQWHRIVAANKTAPAMNGGISMPTFFLTTITLTVSLWRSAKSSTQPGAAKGDPLAATGMPLRLTLFYHWKNW